MKTICDAPGTKRPISRNGHSSSASNVAEVAVRRGDGERDDERDRRDDDRADLGVAAAHERRANQRPPAGRSRYRRERRRGPRARIRLPRCPDCAPREHSARGGGRLRGRPRLGLERREHRRRRDAAEHQLRRRARHRRPVHDRALRHASAPPGPGRAGERPLRRAPRRARRPGDHRLLQRARA